MYRSRRAYLASVGALVTTGCLGRRVGTDGGTTSEPGTATEAATSTTSTVRGTGESVTESPGSGSTTSTTPTDEVTITPESALQWRRSFGADVALGPAVVDGTVYVGTADGTVHALAPGGDERWQTTVSGEFFAGTGHDNSPVVAGETVYLTSGNQSGAHGSDYAVYALDAATGRKRWSSGTDSPSFLSLLAVVDGTVYTATSDDVVGGRDETLAAHDAGSGERVWTAEIGDPEAVGTGSGALALADYAGLQVVETDGTVRWRSGDLEGTAPHSPAFAGGHLLVASDRSENGLYALDPETGERRWSRTDAFVNSLTVRERAYVGGQTVAAHEFDGTRSWDAGVQAFVERVHGDTLYCGIFSGQDGGGALALSTTDGSELWRHEVDADIAEVRAVDDAIAAVDLQGVPAVDGLDPATGDRRFRLEASDRRGPSSPTVEGGTAYVASGSTLYALG